LEREDLRCPADESGTERDRDVNPPRVGEDFRPVDRDVDCHLAASHNSWPRSVIRTVRLMTRAARTPRRALASATFTAGSVSSISYSSYIAPDPSGPIATTPNRTMRVRYSGV